MQIGSAMHSDEELLEEYAFGRLPEAEAAGIEEHLFICEHCQTRLTGIEEFVNATKAAASELRASEKTSKSGVRSLLSGRWWQIPKPIWAAGFAGLVVSLLIPFRTQPQSAAQTEVQLTASRGSSFIAHASPNAKVRLRIEAGRLTPRPAYQIEVVNAAGAQVWKTQAAPSGGQLTALIPRPLPAGTYYLTGGGLTISGNAQVTGTGVLIYVTGLTGSNPSAVNISVTIMMMLATTPGTK